MGRNIPSRDTFRQARINQGVTHNVGVTRAAEERARVTGMLSKIVDPAINPIRRSLLRLDPYRGKEFIVTVGPPMDIEVDMDTTGSMGGEVDTEMAVMPDVFEKVAQVLQGYDPQYCMGIFGDCGDPFVLCRPQFEMESEKIVRYLKEMAPQKMGQGNGGEDPQYGMFARAYLADTYTNRIGLKGYHFVVTDEPCHHSLTKGQIRRIFGDKIFENELSWMAGVPSVQSMIQYLKQKAHQFIFVVDGHYDTKEALRDWRDLCGEQSVITIPSTKALPEVIAAVIGLTEGTLNVTEIRDMLGSWASPALVQQLSLIDIGAQVQLRHALPHPLPKRGDIFASKSDLWPIRTCEEEAGLDPGQNGDKITYL